MNIDDNLEPLGTRSDDANTKIFIGGIRETVGNDQLQKEFEHCGQIMKVWIARSPFSKGYAFIEFAEPGDAKRAVREMNGKALFGSKRILVQFSKQKHGIEQSRNNNNALFDGDFNQSCSTDDFGDEHNKTERRNRSRSPRHLTEYGSTDRLLQNEQRLSDKPPFSRPSRDRQDQYYNSSPPRGSRRHRSISPDRSSRDTERYSRRRSRSRSKGRGRVHRKDDCITEGTKLDGETVSKIKESVIKETIPHMYAMFVKEMFNMMQNQPNLINVPQTMPNYPPITTPIHNTAPMYNQGPAHFNKLPSNFRNPSTKPSANLMSPTGISAAPTNMSSPRFHPSLAASGAFPYRNSTPNTDNDSGQNKIPMVSGFNGQPQQARFSWIRYPVNTDPGKSTNARNGGRSSMFTPPEDL